MMTDSKRIKAILSVLLVLSLLTSVFLIHGSSYEFYEYYKSQSLITSKDGKYIYKQSENNDEAVFWGSTQKNITVLEIPDEIDGKKVTGVERIFTMSKAVTKLVLGKNIKTIGYGGLKLSYVTPSFENVYNWIKYDEYKEVAPLINIRFNEGLETIESFAMREAPCMAEAPVMPKILVLPTTLKKMESSAIMNNRIEFIVIQSDVEAKKYSVNHSQYDHGSREAADYTLELDPISIYFTGDSLNSSPFAFNYLYINFGNFEAGPLSYPSAKTTIYKKVGAQGFEKFETSDYPEEYDNCKLETMTVKTYEDEWWKDIKEVESVTITADNIIEDASLKNTLSSDEKKYVSNTYSLNTNGFGNITLKANASPSDAFDSRVFYVSLNDEVATVDRETGKVKIVGDGSATIRCVSASGVFSDCVINANRSVFAKVISAVQNFFASVSTAIINFFNSISSKLFK